MATIKKGLPGSRQQKTPLTPEEQKEQIKLAFLQKKALLAEEIMIAMIRSGEYKGTAEAFISDVDALATEFIKVELGYELKPKEE